MGELLSVVVPVYNTEKYLRKCIHSILGQTYKDIEIIIVNDGSTDRSEKICSEFDKKFSNVFIINKKNEGVMKARATGIKRATGKWIAFVDSDDWIEPDMYQRMFEQLEIVHGQIAVLCDYTIRPVRFGNNEILLADNALKLLCQMQFATSMWTTVYPLELVRKIENFSEIHFFEDFLFNYNVLHKIQKIALCHGYFYHYRNNAESINHQKLNDKRMSCLKIIPMILEGGRFYDNKLKEEIMYAAAYFLICNITLLKRTDHNYKKYAKELQKICRKYKKEVSNSDYVPCLYKFLINLCGKHPVFVSYIMSIRI